jgi:hypothetical protein
MNGFLCIERGYLKQVGGTIVKGDVLERRTRGSFGRYVGTYVL